MGVEDALYKYVRVCRPSAVSKARRLLRGGSRRVASRTERVWDKIDGLVVGSMRSRSS